MTANDWKVGDVYLTEDRKSVTIIEVNDGIMVLEATHGMVELTAIYTLEGNPIDDWPYGKLMKRLSGIQKI